MQLCSALQLKNKEMVCFIGAGGKTSLMSRLALEGAAEGRRVLVTTSTKMFRSQLEACGCLTVEQDETTLLLKLRALLPDNLILAAGAARTAEDKVIGFSAKTLNRIYRTGMFDCILVEADGARGKSLKAPAAHEPVLPSQANHVLHVTGVDVVGCPLTEEYVFRQDLVAEAAGQEIGTTVSGQTIARVGERYALLAAGMCPGAKFVSVLNKADNEELARQARRIAPLLLKTGKVIIVSGLLSDPVREVVA